MKQALIESITSRIREAVNPKQIFLFGSRAGDDYRDDSDYDLLIIYDGPKTKKDVDLQIRKLFGLPDFSLDLFILTSAEFTRHKHVANTLAREVSENGVLLYGNSTL